MRLSFKLCSLLIFTLLLSINGCKDENPYFANLLVVELPADNSYQYQHSISFQWQHFDLYSNNLQIANDNAFTQVLLDTLCDTGFVVISRPDLLELGKKYYWRVYADPYAGSTIFSDVRSFNIIDTRDSICGTFASASLHYQLWDMSNSIWVDTTYDTPVTISKVSPEKIKVQCSALGSLTDMPPHPDNNPFHFGNDGLLISPYNSCNYDTVLRKILLEYYSGDNSAGHRYRINIFK
ncbi:MAG: hypothetical protein U0T74_00380 [Chitinophagales bacterium]